MGLEDRRRRSSPGGSSTAAPAALGWATSGDAGAHWRTGTLPLGEYFAASDPVVAFDAAHHVWLIAGIGFRGRYHEVFVSRSPDGVTWSQPVVAADDADEDHDKEWVGCDNSARSPFRGRCYLAYVDTTRWLLGIRTSDDGGQTWSKPLRLQPGVTGRGAVFSGPIPVTRPNGDLVVPYSFFAPINERGRGIPRGGPRGRGRLARRRRDVHAADSNRRARGRRRSNAGSARRRCRAQRSTRPERCTSRGRTGASAAARA